MFIKTLPMKKMIVLFLISCAIYACGKAGSTSNTATVMTPEEQLCRTTCTKCHGFKNPNKHTAAEWPRVVDEMQNKRRGHNFTDEDKARILIYLTANAKK
jgi:hypothetical protein